MYCEFNALLIRQLIQAWELNVCMFVIVDRLTKLLPGLSIIVLLSYYVLFYICHFHDLFHLIGFFVTFFYVINPAFCTTNSSRKTLDTRQKLFYAALVTMILGVWNFSSVLLILWGLIIATMISII